jgi:hypothetical protein
MICFNNGDEKMSVRWLFEENPVDPEETGKMRDAAKTLGLETANYRLIQLFSGLGDPFPDTPDTTVFFFGSLQMARKIKREKKWRPGAWLTLDNYLCSNYCLPFGPFMFNMPFSLMRFENLISKRYELDEKYGGHGCLFIRPDSGFKPFTGTVFDVNDLQAKFNLMDSFQDVHGDTIVMVSSPKTITAEWRLFIVGEKIVAGSRYRLSGRFSTSPDVPSEIIEFGTQVLAKTTYRPDPGWTMDICTDADGKPWLLEIGSLSCSGIYDADAMAVVLAVTGILG